MKLKNVIFIMALVYIPFRAISQQLITLEIVNNSSLQEINSIDSTQWYEGTMSEAKFILQESNGDSLAGLSVCVLDYSGEDDFSWQLFNANDTAEFYGFTIRNNELIIEDHLGVIILGGDIDSSDRFEIYRCENEIIYALKDQVIFQRPHSSFNDSFYVKVDSEFASEAKIQLNYYFPEYCMQKMRDFKQDYYTLAPFVEWRNIPLNGDTLKLKYVERYAIEAGVNDSCRVEIFDESYSSTVHSINLANNYGINFQEIDISQFPLIEGNKYNVRVNGINKNEEYYLRMTYK